MNSKQFQTESVMTLKRHRPNRWSNDLEFGRRFNTAAAQSAMLGFLLRGFFTNYDKDFLDSLAPARSLAFVLKSDTFLHPKSVQLFDPSIVNSIRDHHQTAIFSHTCTPVPGSLNRHKITTGILNPGQDQPLFIGLLGPDHEISGANRENDFVETVTALRNAFETARRALQDFQESYDHDAALIIVNRASGRVIHVTPCAAKLCGHSAEHLVDLEFHAIKAELPKLRPGIKLSLAHFSHQEISLGVLHLDNSAQEWSAKNDRIRFLLEQCESSLHRLQFGTDSSVTGRVIGPVGKLSHCLKAFRQNLTGSDDTATPGNILICLDSAIRNLIGGVRSNYLLKIRTYGGNFQVNCPPNILTQLFGSLLLAHLDSKVRPFQTDIQIDFAGKPALRITTIAADNAGPLEPNKRWLTELENFHDYCQITHVRPEKGTRIETRITFEEIADQ